MDEPLSNLDAKLRVDMRAEIVKLHRKLGVTTFYVTHDQTEAMTMGQRIVVMRDGCIQQIDTPNALYARPANMFVAGFIGTPSMNFMKMRVGDDARSLKGETAHFRAGDAFTGGLLEPHRGQEIWVGIRPEHLQHYEGEASALENGLTGVVDVVEPLGSVTMVQLEVDGHRVTAQLEGDTRVRSGDTITLTCDSARLHLFDANSEQALAKQPAESEATA